MILAEEFVDFCKFIEYRQIDGLKYLNIFTPAYCVISHNAYRFVKNKRINWQKLKNDSAQQILSFPIAFFCRY